MARIQNLPYDVLLQILGQLRPVDRQSCAVACPSWQPLVLSLEKGKLRLSLSRLPGNKLGLGEIDAARDSVALLRGIRRRQSVLSELTFEELGRRVEEDVAAYVAELVAATVQPRSLALYMADGGDGVPPQWLVTCTRLESLVLGGISEMPPFELMPTTLTALEFDHTNGELELPPELADLTALRNIAITGSCMDGLEVLSWLPNLQHLKVENNDGGSAQFEDLHWLQCLSGLTHLTLSGLYVFTEPYTADELSDALAPLT